MRTVNISGKKVQFYDTIKQLPIDRYNEMQRYVLQESGIGSTMADVDGHLNNLDMYLAADRIEDARKERTNLQINLYAMLNGINFESLAFACLVHSINGKHTGYTDDELKDTLKQLKGITVEQVADTLDELKKNFIRS